MTAELLQRIIDDLESITLKDRGTFGIFRYGGGSDESYIQADKEGLKRFALELLKAASKTEETLDDQHKNIVPIDSDSDWVNDDSDTFIEYITPVSEYIPKPKIAERKETMFEKLLPIGCYAALIFLIAAILIGIGTMIKWVF